MLATTLGLAQTPITIVINAGTGSEASISLHPSIINFSIALLDDSGPNEHCCIPESINTSPAALYFMQEFVEAHKYNPESVRINKPLLGGRLEDKVDKLTFRLVEKFTRIQNIRAAISVISLAHFIRFQQLFDSVVAAVLSIFAKETPQMQVEVEGIKNKEVSGWSSYEVMTKLESFIGMSEQAEKERLYEQELHKFAEY